MLAAACKSSIVSNNGTISMLNVSFCQPLNNNKPYTSITPNALWHWLIMYLLQPASPLSCCIFFIACITSITSLSTSEIKLFASIVIGFSCARKCIFSDSESEE